MEWNIHGLNNAQKFDKETWTSLTKCDIVGLTETWHTTNSTCNELFENFFIIFDSKAIKEKSKGRPSGGIVLLINKNLKPEKINLIENNSFYITIELILHKSSLIVSFFYLSPCLCDKVCAEILDECLADLEKFNNSNVVIIGDFNGRVGKLNQIYESSVEIDNDLISNERFTNDFTINKRGRMLCEIFEFHGFILLNGRSKNDNPAKFTFIGKNGKSIVDLAWVNHQALTNTTNFEIKYSGSISDHLPCMVKLKTQVNIENIKQKCFKNIVKFKWNQTRQLEYSNRLSQKFENSVEQHDIPRILRKISEAGKDCGMEKTITISNDREPTIRKNLWFNDDCRKVKSELNKATRKLRNNNTNENNLEMYKNARKKYLSVVNRTKKAFEAQLKAKLLDVKNNEVFWNTVKSFKPKKSCENFIALERWQNFLEETQKTTETEENLMISEVISEEDLDKPISLFEIKNALKKMKAGKSPGCDGISNEFLKNLPEPALRTLQKAFNNIFETREIDESWANIDIKMLFKKGDREDPQNYRPIALENSSLKLLMNIINTRLMNWAEKNEVVPEYQNGFRPKRGCIDNIFIINCLIELTINQPTNNALFAVFIDFKGAFNSVKHHKLC